MKSREHVTNNGKAAFYACMWDDLRQAALNCGWALGLHGSLASDMDIMAMPWTEAAKPVEEMIQALSDCFTENPFKDRHTVPHYDRPNGRVVYTMSIWADFYLDINVITDKNKKTKYMSLKSFFSKIFNFLKKEIKALPQQSKDALHIAVTVTDGLKKLIDSPVADVFTALFPGDTDDKVIGMLRAKLPAILTEMRLLEACAGETDPVKLVECAVRELGKLTGDAKKNYLDSIATLIAQVSADGKLSWDDAKYLVKPYYDLIYKPKK